MKKRRTPTSYLVKGAIIALKASASLLLIYLLASRIPRARIVLFFVEMACLLKIVASDDSPEYKVPWLITLLLIPGGFVLYIAFYRRRLSSAEKELLCDIGRRAPRERARQSYSTPLSRLVCRACEARLYSNCPADYFEGGREMLCALLCDLERAREFIFLEYFIVEEGELWSRVHEVLRRKAADGVEVRLIYDDVGCMRRLPRGFVKRLAEEGIYALPHAPVRAVANNSFNNRTHRKITVIDGRIAYTGGINLTDEYIGRWECGGVLKDTAVRIFGEGVNELCYLFLCDFARSRGVSEDFEKYYRYGKATPCEGYALPFGDGPRPVYSHRVTKTALLGLIAEAKEYLYITTPYLITDSELCSALEIAAARGVDVRIATPHLPDKRWVFLLTRDSYRRLCRGGVRIYEYLPGFLHAKTYIADGRAAILGTMNLDYRSLAHNFENGILFIEHPVIKTAEADFRCLLSASRECFGTEGGGSAVERLTCTLIKIFSPLL